MFYCDNEYYGHSGGGRGAHYVPLWYITWFNGIFISCGAALAAAFEQPFEQKVKFLRLGCFMHWRQMSFGIAKQALLPCAGAYIVFNRRSAREI